MQLIVLGMHRSGTSVLARALNLMGAYFGPEGVSTGANQENPKGFWERRDVRALNDAVLQGAGCDWNRVLRFDPARLPAELQAAFDKRASRLLLELDAHRPWLLKEPRLCLLLPLWRKWLEAPICIHVFRHPAEVASSLRMRNGIPLEAGVLLWERYVRSALAGAEGLPSVHVSHRELMDSPRTAIERLHGDLERLGVRGLRMPGAREVDAFVEDRLYRERESRPDLQHYADTPQVALFRAIEGGLEASALAPESDMAPLAAFEAALPPLEPSPMPDVFPDQQRPATRDAETDRKALQALEKRLAKAEEERGAFEKRLATAEEKRVALEGTLADEAARNRRLAAESAERQARLDAIGAQYEQAGRDRIALEARMEEQAIAAAELEARRLAAEDQVRAIAARTAEAERKAAVALQDIARLTRRLLHRDLELEQLAAQHAEAGTLHAAERQRLAKEAGALRAQAAAAEQRAADMEQRLAALTGSFTWRAGRPVRALGRRIRALLGRDGTPDQRLVRKSGLLDPRWYLERYPDVAASGLDPAEHYLAFGAGEGRDPGPGFNTRRYLQRNPDVARSGMNALVHYVRFGREEGRKPC